MAGLLGNTWRTLSSTLADVDAEIMRSLSGSSGGGGGGIQRPTAAGAGSEANGDGREETPTPTISTVSLLSRSQPPTPERLKASPLTAAPLPTAELDTLRQQHAILKRESARRIAEVRCRG